MTRCHAKDHRRRGSASVEHLAVTALIAAALAGAIALLSTGSSPAERGLADLLGRRLACAPRHPVPCNRNPLALAYGFPVGKLVRALAPAAVALPGVGGAPLLPVDFRRCRRPSCAAPGTVPGLTASLRRVTLFTWVEDRRPAGGPVEIEYWHYRPSLGWSQSRALAGPAEIAVAAAIRLRVTDVPALVPLETLPGRNHARFPRGEQPPWRWR